MISVSGTVKGFQHEGATYYAALWADGTIAIFTALAIGQWRFIGYAHELA